MSEKSSPTHHSGTADADRPVQRPLLRVGILVVALLLIGEQFPFSYFPMYSSFDPEADYYYVANTDGQPYACVEIFGTSTANVKKMYRARLRELVGKRGAREADATEAERREVGEEMLEYLRALGARSGRTVPADNVVLKRVLVQRDNEGVITRQEIYIAEG